MKKKNDIRENIQIIFKTIFIILFMYWSLELAGFLDDAPWPATKDELIDYAIRSGAPIEVIENLQLLEDDMEEYDSIEDIWADYPSRGDFFVEEEDDERY